MNDVRVGPRRSSISMSMSTAARPALRRGAGGLVFAALALVAVGCSGTSEGTAAVGIAPLAAEAGTDPVDEDAATTLRDVVDGPTVVNVWASWCAPCRLEMPALEQVHMAAGDDVAVIGITDDADPQAAAALAEELGVTYPLYLVTEPGGLRHLGVTGLPATVFVDASGEIVGSHAGAMDAAEIARQIEQFHAVQIEGVTP